MEKLKLIKFEGKKIKGLPLFFSKIYYNQVTDINDEMKLFKYNESLQCNFMRHYFPNLIICKTIDYNKFEDEE